MNNIRVYKLIIMLLAITQIYAGGITLKKIDLSAYTFDGKIYPGFNHLISKQILSKTYIGFKIGMDYYNHSPIIPYSINISLINPERNISPFVNLNMGKVYILENKSNDVNIRGLFYDGRIGISKAIEKNLNVYVETFFRIHQIKKYTMWTSGPSNYFYLRNEREKFETVILYGISIGLMAF